MPAVGRQPRVIFVGLDGADWQLLDQFMTDGTMPNLARLAREGDRRVLLTIHPPLSPLVWTTELTGVSPLEHRIPDFTRFNPLPPKKQPLPTPTPPLPPPSNMSPHAPKHLPPLA